jgi:hypothetical protein
VEAKEHEADTMIAEMKASHNELCSDMKDKTESLVNSIKWRIEDCETLVKGRITESYVRDLGKSIERNIVESVS